MKWQSLQFAYPPPKIKKNKNKNKNKIKNKIIKIGQQKTHIRYELTKKLTGYLK